MTKKLLSILILSVMIFGQSFAHTGKPRYHVIIDTDGNLDDMRSLSMFLAGNDIRVLGITCSQGNFLPDSVYVKVRSLLSVFHHEGIQIGVGDKTGLQQPERFTSDQDIPWTKVTEKSAFENREKAIPVLNRIAKNYRAKITLIALGSLETYADWLRSNPAMIEKVDKMIWYQPPSIDNDFNTRTSPESYKYIRQSGIKLVIVGQKTAKLAIDEAYLDSIKNSNSLYARQIENILTRTDAIKQMDKRTLQLSADIVPLYLTIPVLFDSEEEDGVTISTLNEGIPESYLYEAIVKLLESATTTNNRVFNAFPVDPSLYKTEYAKILNSTLEKFGPIEWKAICLTNEIHGHTGIYSIIGAKMGIRAIEYFNVGVNNLTVTTFAGHTPPLSCFNDGIQISTGATIGQGLITVNDSTSMIPGALFKFNSRTVNISLKPEIAAQMQREIAHGTETYGSLTDQYWRYIEELAIQYWKEFNRYDIFDIVLVQ